MIHEREQWFIDRIGKRVFRENNGCKCETCKRVTVEGLIILNEQHASYLYDMEGMSREENSKHIITYKDTKE